MSNNEENIFKSSGKSGSFREEIKEDLERNIGKFNDPVVLGELLYKLLEERENTNRILKNILSKLEKLEGKGVQETRPEILLSDIDEEILTFVKGQQKTTSEEVRKRFNYKGKNAASARLNRLFELGLVNKKQVGKKVFFLPK